MSSSICGQRQPGHRCTRDGVICSVNNAQRVVWVAKTIRRPTDTRLETEAFLCLPCFLLSRQTLQVYPLPGFRELFRNLPTITAHRSHSVYNYYPELTTIQHVLREERVWIPTYLNYRRKYTGATVPSTVSKLFDSIQATGILPKASVLVGVRDVVHKNPHLHPPRAHVDAVGVGGEILVVVTVDLSSPSEVRGQSVTIAQAAPVTIPFGSFYVLDQMRRWSTTHSFTVLSETVPQRRFLIFAVAVPQPEVLSFSQLWRSPAINWRFPCAYFWDGVDKFETVSGQTTKGTDS